MSALAHLREGAKPDCDTCRGKGFEVVMLRIEPERFMILPCSICHPPPVN